MPIEMMLRTRRSASWRASSSIVRMRRATSCRACSSTRASSASRAWACVIAATRSSSRSCCSTSCETRASRSASVVSRSPRRLSRAATSAASWSSCAARAPSRSSERATSRLRPLSCSSTSLRAASMCSLAATSASLRMASASRWALASSRSASARARSGGAAATAHVDDGERSPDGKSHKGQYCLEHGRSPRAGRRAPCGPVQSCLGQARRQVAEEGFPVAPPLESGSNGAWAPSRRVVVRELPARASRRRMNRMSVRPHGRAWDPSRAGCADRWDARRARAGRIGP